MQGGHASTPAMALGEVGRLRGGGGKDGSRRKGQEARAFLRRSRRKETKSPAATFIEKTHRGHTACTEDQGGKRETVARFTAGEKFEAPTPSVSHARRTRTLISQAKRPIRSGHNGTAVSIPHAPRLKRSALKSYVRAVPSRASGARPPADQGHKAVSVGHSFHLARPLLTPSENRKVVPVGRRFRLARPRYYRQV